MKPKYHRTIRKAFPSLIVIPAMAAMLPSVSHGAAIISAPNGSLNVTSLQTGVNHIVLNGGASPFVQILPGTSLSPDGNTSGINVNSAYFQSSTGIFAAPSGNTQPATTTLTPPTTGGIINDGSITGNREGLDANDNQILFINNVSLTGLGTGTGTGAGIFDVGDNSIIINTGTILGGDSSAIRGVVNFFGGSTDGVTVHNSGTLTGSDAGAGIFLDDNTLVINSGTITGGGNNVVGAVSLGANSTLYNLTGATITSTSASAGFAANILQGDGTLNLYNWGTINGGTAGIAAFGSTGVDNFFLNSGSLINGDVLMGLGADGLTVTSDYTGNVTVNGDLNGGFGDDTITINADATDNIGGFQNGTVFINGDILTGLGDDILEVVAQGNGSVYINGSVIDTIGSDDLSFSTFTGGLIYLNGGIDAGFGTTDSLTVGGGVGVDIITLSTFASGASTGSNVVNGNVLGAAGLDTLNLVGGLVTSLDFTNDVTFDDYVESMRGTGMNLIIGDVQDIQNLNKTGTGMALITGYDPTDAGAFNDAASHEIDDIRITNGSLYINGSLDKTPLAANLQARTNIDMTTDPGDPLNPNDDTFAEELGGTGTWNADIYMDHGGFSAGQIAMNLDWDLMDLVGPAISSIGTVDLTGTLEFSNESFIRYDLKPQLDTTFPILGGTDADLIRHNGGGSGVLFGTDTYVRMSPSDINNVVSDGTYVVVRSTEDISGIPDEDVGVQFNANVGDFGPFSGSLVPSLSNVETANVFGTTLALFTTPDIVSNGDGGEDLVLVVEHDYEGLGEELGENEASLGAALDNSVDSPNPLIQDFIAALDYSDIDTVNATLTSLVPSGVFGLTSGVINSNYRLHRLAQNHLAATRSGTIIEMTADTVDAKGHTVPGTTSSSASGNGNIWGTFSYDWQDSDNVDGEVAAFTVGADYRVAPNLLIGLMLDGSQADNDFSGGSSDVDSLRAAIYATYGASTGIYADFLVGYGDHDLDLDRTFAGVPGLGGTSGNSNTDATSLQAMAIVGYAMESGCLKHGPFAGLEYQNVDVDSFTQTGPLPIGVDGFDVDSLRALVGYRVEATYGNFSPYASIAYAHEFEDGPQSTTATLPGGARFRVDGGELDSALLLGVGTGYSFNANLGMNIGYRGEISTGDGMDSHGGSIGVNYSF